MSREIKFRVFDSIEKKFVDFGVGGLRSDYTLNDIFEDNFNDGLRYVIQQFTGLLDRDLREIYEGDICDAGMVVGDVYYSIGGFRLASNQLLEYLPNDPEDYKVLDIKIIGHIFD